MPPKMFFVTILDPFGSLFFEEKIAISTKRYLFTAPFNYFPLPSCNRPAELIRRSLGASLRTIDLL